MLRYILNNILAWIFSLLKRDKSEYPDELKQATKDKYIRSIDEMNKKGDE